MKIYIYDNSQEISNNILNCNDIKNKVLLLPTGSTPLNLYKEIIARKIDFSNITTFNLDEYYPISKDSTSSFNYYMFHNLFNHVNINNNCIHMLDGNTNDVVKECSEYSKKILDNKIDIAFLGVGVNGHIAFNEPVCYQLSVTRMVTLNKCTQVINNTENTTALTVGISEILSSKTIITMAIGETKADIIYDFLYYFYNKKLTPTIPLTYLLQHNDCTLYIDRMAMSTTLSKLSKQFIKYKKIMIFSPHPDDDVIGMGATIKKMIDVGIDITVMYQTSGANGGDILTRQKESINALKLLGLYNETKIIFGNSPFYSKTIKNITNDDYEYTLNFIDHIKPDVIFFAGDICDPHLSHLKCYKIIQKCLKKLPDITAYNYYSAWDAPSEYNIIEYFDKIIMEQKINSIKEHASQLNPKYSGNLQKDFYEIIEKRNKLDVINSSDIYCEGFTKYQ